MSIRRKFVIALNIIAVCIASLSYAVHRYIVTQTPASVPTVEMQLLPIQNLVNAQHCGASCVITSRSALGINN